MRGSVCGTIDSTGQNGDVDVIQFTPSYSGTHLGGVHSGLRFAASRRKRRLDGTEQPTGNTQPEYIEVFLEADVPVHLGVSGWEGNAGEWTLDIGEP